jgi:hypothetical protein
LGGPGLPPHFRRGRSPQRSLMLARARSIFHWPSRARMSIMGRQISAPEHRPRAGLPPCSRREPSSEGSRRLAKARSYFSMAFTSKFSDPVQSDPPRIRPLRSISSSPRLAAGGRSPMRCPRPTIGQLARRASDVHRRNTGGEDDPRVARTQERRDHNGLHSRAQPGWPGSSESSGPAVVCRRRTCWKPPPGYLMGASGLRCFLVLRAPIYTAAWTPSPKR